MTEDERVDPVRLAAEVIADAEASSEVLDTPEEVLAFWSEVVRLVGLSHHASLLCVMPETRKGGDE